jgi:hypothetical protein
MHNYEQTVKVNQSLLVAIDRRLTRTHDRRLSFNTFKVSQYVSRVRMER